MPNKSRPRANKAQARLSRELANRPHSFVPPMDPPTVQSNPVRRVVVDLFVSVPGTTPFTAPVTAALIRQQVQDQTGLASAKVFFIPTYVAAWVATAGGTNPGVSSPVSLKITDSQYGIESRDDPAPLVNARVGIKYPKNIQEVVNPALAGTTTLWTLAQTGLSSAVAVTLRVGCDVWGSSL